MTTATAIPIAAETEYKAARADLGWSHLSDADKRYEVVNGELVELPPMRMSQSIVAGAMFRLFDRHISSENLPFLTSIEASFTLGLPRGSFRTPDLHVTAARRVIAAIEDEPRSWEGSPNIAVEVISATDAYVDVIAKAQLYLRHGVSTVLLVDAYHREVTVRQAGGEIRILAADDTLTGEPTLPGFSCRVSEIFSDLDRLLTPETDGN